MKILFQSRIDTFTKPGGDTSQIKAYQKNLTNLGADIDISACLEPNLNAYDIIHLFNLTRPYELYVQAQNAKKYNKKIILTPLYQNFNEWDQKGRYGFQKLFFGLIKNKNNKELIKNSLRFSRNRLLFKTVLKNKYTDLQKQVIRLSDMFIVGSKMEMQALKDNFYIDKNYTIAYNGVSLNFGETSPDLFINKYKLKNFVLCVANFSSIKNHLNLIKAVKQTNLPLVLVGNKIKFHGGYYNKIKSLSNKNKQITVLENMPPELIASAYAASKVHVLPSWFENSPLVNLEAGLSGCNIVSTNRGYSKEYLKDMAWYCEPSDISSIKNSVLNAYNTPKSDELKNFILKNYSWEKTAQKIFNAYQTIEPTN